MKNNSFKLKNIPIQNDTTKNLNTDKNIINNNGSNSFKSSSSDSSRQNSTCNMNTPPITNNSNNIGINFIFILIILKR